MDCSNQILQNLEDAGCSDVLIREYQQIAAQPLPPRAISGKQAELLCRYRRELLDEMHSAQKRIDCLDYLLYQLRSQKE